MDTANFAKTDFKFHGIYRGVVEDNADPDDIGRLKVRVYEIHNLDGTVTPISQIPWAKPALGLSWSGGYNITNEDHQNNSPDTPGNRYDPGPNAKVSGTNNTVDTPQPNNTKFQAQINDPYLNAYGTGGQFVIPKRGNWVFLFFEAGNHMNPVYFAMAPNGRDWTAQESQRNTDISQKVNQIDEFRQEFRPREKSVPSDNTSWASTAVVNSLVDVPELEIDEISEMNSNRDIFCTTSAQGTTIVIDNRLNNERLYIIHKNFIDYTDESGNKKIYAGKARGLVSPSSNDPDVPSNFEIGIEGNHQVFILGDYDLYTRGNANIQVDGNAQIDVYKSVGIVSRQGDVDVIIEQGNLDVDIKGNANINVGDYANIHVETDANILVEEDLNITVNGNMNGIVQGTARMEIQGNLDATIQGNALINAVQTLQITCPDVRVSGNVSIGGQLNVTGDISTAGNAKVQGVAFITSGVDCGGYIKNNGLCDLGGPCTLHNVIVLGGSGTGTGRGANPVSTPTTPPLPSQASYEAGPNTDKSDLLSGTTPNESNMPPTTN